MGAQVFTQTKYGSDAKVAFKEAKEQAQYEYGHSGYSGSLAEKHSYVELPLIEGMDAYSSAMEYINRCDPRIDDKFGPAGCIKTFDEEYKLDQFLFFGWASC